MTDAPTPPASEEATWFKVLLALRWPVALVLASAMLGGVLLRVLSRPIPIRLAMPLDQPLAVTARVDQLAEPLKVEQLDKDISVSLNKPVDVSGTVDVESPKPISISGEPRVVLTSPVQVKADAPLAVQASVDVAAAKPLPVQGAVDVRAQQPLPVQGKVDVDLPQPVQVHSEVILKSEEQPVQIEVRGGLFGIF
jgi:hypothetical protein